MKFNTSPKMPEIQTRILLNMFGYSYMFADDTYDAFDNIVQRFKDIEGEVEINDSII